jgi:hypothetical protein
MVAETKKHCRGLGGEGMLAKWQVRNTAKSMDDYRRNAAKLAQAGASFAGARGGAGPRLTGDRAGQTWAHAVAGLINDTSVRLAADNGPQDPINSSSALRGSGEVLERGPTDDAASKTPSANGVTPVESDVDLRLGAVASP